jgi:hypothetical protein
MGNPSRGRGLPSEMYRVRTPDHDRKKTGGKKHKKFTEKE